MNRTIKIHPEAFENHRLLEKFNTSERQKQIKQQAQDKDFELGKQWTDKEIKELEERGQYPLVIPRILPVIRQKQAQLNASNPSFRCVPVDDGDVKVARMLSELLTYVWNISRGRTQLGLAIDDALVKGIGYLYAYIDKYADFGRGEVKIKHLNPEDVFVDPNAREKDFSDAQHILIYKELSASQVANLVPEWSPKKIAGLRPQASGEFLHKTTLNSYEDVILPSDMTSDESKYRWIERYTKRKKLYYIIQGENGVETISEDEFRQRAEQLTPEEFALFQSEAARIYLDRVELTITCENELVSKGVLETSHYPVIPLPYIWTGTPYPMSEVRMLRGLQREVNKRRSLMIAHASASTNPRLMVQEGSVENIAELERSWARPAAVIRYLPGTQPPTQHSPLALPAALYQLEAEAKYDIEYAAGVFSLSQGDSTHAPETFKGTMAIEEFGNRRIQLTAQMVNEALSQLGRVVVELIQSNYTIEKTIRIVQPDGDESSFVVNQPVYDDYQQVVSRVNDITVGRYDVYFVAGSTMASNRWAMLEELVKLYQLGIIDDIEVLKKTEVFDTPRLLERKSMLSQTMNQNKEMQDMLKQMQEELGTLRSKNMELEKKLVIKEFKENLQRELDEIGLQKAADQKMRMLEKRELQLEKQKIKTKNQKEKPQQKSK